MAKSSICKKFSCSSDERFDIDQSDTSSQKNDDSNNSTHSITKNDNDHDNINYHQDNDHDIDINSCTTSQKCNNNGGTSDGSSDRTTLENNDIADDGDGIDDGVEQNPSKFLTPITKHITQKVGETIHKTSKSCTFVFIEVMSHVLVFVFCCIHFCDQSPSK